MPKLKATEYASKENNFKQDCFGVGNVTGINIIGNFNICFCRVSIYSLWLSRNVKYFIVKINFKKAYNFTVKRRSLVYF